MKKILLIVTLFTFGISNSQNLFKDDFASFTVATNLSGQGSWTNNSSLIGGGGACAGPVGLCANSKVVANAISYPAYGTSANSIEIKPDLDFCGRGFTAVSSGDLYVGMVLNLSSTLTSTNDFFRVMSGSNFSTTFSMNAKNNGTSFFLGVKKSAAAAPTYTTNTYAYNQNHLVVFKYSINPGTSDDVLSIYVDSNFIMGVPMTSDATTSAGNDTAGSPDRLGFRQNSPTTTNGKTGLVSASTTWNGLSFIPLSTEQFNKSTFSISANEVKSGILSINSVVSIEKIALNIYDIQGRLINSKTTNIYENNNQININPIHNSGIYIVEIATENNKISQKIVVN